MDTNVSNAWLNGVAWAAHYVLAASAFKLKVCAAARDHSMLDIMVGGVSHFEK